MKPLFTIHAGEYLVGEYIERTYPKWNVWIPSKDTGIDFLITDGKNKKTASIQVKFSKDFSPSLNPLFQSRLMSIGWWKHDLNKVKYSNADYWIFVLPAFVEKQVSFIILPPKELLRRMKAIFGSKSKHVHSHLQVTKAGKCWEGRGLPKTDQELIAWGRFSDKERNFTPFLNNWKQIEAELI